MVTRSYPELVAVCGLSEIKKTVSRTKSTALISLLDRDDRLFLPPKITRAKHLRLAMSDVADSSADFAPNDAHVARILSFFNDLQPHDILTVNCQAGVSRSTATALALLSLSSDPDHAAMALSAMRPSASPNPLLVQLFDAALNHNGALVRAADRLRGRSAFAQSALRSDF